MRKTSTQLSEEGERRRREILDVALAESRRIRKMRIYKRAGVAVVLLLAMVTSLHLYRERGQVPHPTLAENDRAAIGNPLPVVSLENTVAHRSDSVDLEDYVIHRHIGDVRDYFVPAPDALPSGIVLSDHQLAIMLAQVGRSDAIVRTPDGVWLERERELFSGPGEIAEPGG